MKALGLLGLPKTTDGAGGLTCFRAEPTSGLKPFPFSDAYEARFGNPPAGTKVFVSVNQNLNGWDDVPHIFSAIVPAST